MGCETSVGCSDCGFELGEYLGGLTVSDVFFVSDHRFPGRCVVTLRRHATELFELDSATRHAFADDMSTAAHAIASALRVTKMNYEILGNADPHLHCHLIPRRADEPNPKAPAWLHPEAQEDLPEEFADVLRARIGGLLPARIPPPDDAEAG